MTGILVKVDAGQLPESITAEIQGRLNYLLRRTQPGAMDDSYRAGRPQTSGSFVMSKATTCGNAIEPSAEAC